MSGGHLKQNSTPEIKPPNFALFHPLNQPRPILPRAPPPPPPPQTTQFNYGARQAASPSFYSPQQYHPRQYGNQYSAGGQFGNGPLPYSRSNNNRRLLSDQESLACQQIVTGNIIKEQNKKLEENDRKIEELLSKVASLEIVTQENVQLRAKLQEFGDIEAKKQELALQEFSLDIKQLEGTEAENLKKELEQCQEARTKAEELVKMWEQCYYKDMNTVVADYKGKLNVKGIPDKTSYKKKLSVMALQRSENDDLKKALAECKSELEKKTHLANKWEKKYNEIKKEWYIILMFKTSAFPIIRLSTASRNYRFLPSSSF